MSILVSSFTITRGVTQQLEIASGEDREFRLAMTSDGSTPIDLTGATEIKMTVRDLDGTFRFARAYAGFQGAATLGTPRFQILQADTVELADGPYLVDVVWVDASGYSYQLLIASTFLILKRVADPDDPLTTPPAIPVVYGIQWGWASGLAPFWTGKSGGYNANDGVMAYDGSLGATAVSTFRAVSQGVTHHPVTGASQVLASGWAYIGQHGAGSAGGGGGGATGPQGATGPEGPTGPAGATGAAGAGSTFIGASGSRSIYLGGAALQMYDFSGGSGNAGYTAMPGDYLINIVSTGASLGIWLPVNATPGSFHLIKDRAGGVGVSYPVLIKPATGYIDGSPTGVVLNGAYARMGVVCYATGLWGAA